MVRHNQATVLATLLVTSLVRSEATAASPATCQAGKNNEAGKYAYCRSNAEAKLVLTGNLAKYAELLAVCAQKYALKWNRLEERAASAGAPCPTNGDDAAVQNVIDGHSSVIVNALAGNPLLDCPAALTSCLAELVGQPLQTGQAACANDLGGSIPCGGTGQDGELQTGVARSYTDNGDGTITDNSTGLMWERKSNDQSIHSISVNVGWNGAFAHVASLNATTFAGHSDWRLPNIRELLSIVKPTGGNVAVDAAFDTGCVTGCTVTTCSCAGGETWSSTAYAAASAIAWVVDFTDGSSTARPKSPVPGPYGLPVTLKVRAVRNAQ